jgi:hypothetical protein
MDVREVPDADETLTTQMKSVGEAMAIGRTFKEALQKGIRSMEVKRFGFGLDKYDKWLNAQKGSGVEGQESGKESPAAPPRVPPTARADVLGGTPNPQLDGRERTRPPRRKPSTTSGPSRRTSSRRKARRPQPGPARTTSLRMKMGGRSSRSTRDEHRPVVSWRR